MNTQTPAQTPEATPDTAPILCAACGVALIQYADKSWDAADVSEDDSHEHDPGFDTETPLDVWLMFDADEDEDASHEANTYRTFSGGFRVEWSHTAVGLITSREFDTYAAAAAWLTAGGYQDFSS